MMTALDRVISLLDLEQIEQDMFRGRSPQGEGRQRVFGGQVAGQALVAAGRTVPADRPVHSLHAYFIRPGDTSVPLIYTVERLRDGRSFTTRRVTAIQHGNAIFTLSASFHVREPGFEHAEPMPDVPDPGEVASEVERLRRLNLPPDEFARDNPMLHVCLMTYASDMTLLDTVLLAQGVSWGHVSGASLDHAMWFHRPFRVDRWLLFVQDSPIASSARGLARGEVYTRDGELVVSVVQEGLLRPGGRRTES